MNRTASVVSLTAKTRRTATYPEITAESAGGEAALTGKEATLPRARVRALCVGCPRWDSNPH